MIINANVNFTFVFVTCEWTVWNRWTWVLSQKLKYQIIVGNEFFTLHCAITCCPFWAFSLRLYCLCFLAYIACILVIGCSFRKNLFGAGYFNNLWALLCLLAVCFFGSSFIEIFINAAIYECVFKHLVGYVSFALLVIVPRVDEKQSSSAHCLSSVFWEVCSQRSFFGLPSLNHEICL